MILLVVHAGILIQVLLMKNAPLYVIVIVAVLLGTGSVKAQTHFLLDLETGVAFTGPYNEIRVPGKEGTPFDVFGAGFKTNPEFFYRIKAGVQLAGRHNFLLLLAPLTTQSKSRNALSEPLLFDGVTFPPGRALKVSYRFNQYRFTYRFDFVRRRALRLGAGASIQLRDAVIVADNGALKQRYAGPGPVPLLNLYLNWQPTPALGLLLAGDALAGGPGGRAIDAFGGITYALRPGIHLKAGYRIFEGGVSIGEIYNYAWVNFASVGIVLRPPQ